MKKLLHFISYNNLVPITISFVLLGTSATYAYNNPEVVYDRSERVVSIDNTYIAAVDFDTFSPSVEILSVEEDDEAYYVSYRLTTIALTDSVWQNVVSNEALMIPKANLGAYRDLGLYVTEELRELVLAEEKRLRETQVFERQNVTRKQLVIEYSGIIGGRLSPEVQTIADYDPVKTPPTAKPESQNFARPDERSTVSKPIAISTNPPPPPAAPTTDVETIAAATTSDSTEPTRGLNASPAATGARSSSTQTNAAGSGTGTNSEIPPTATGTVLDASATTSHTNVSTTTPQITLLGEPTVELLVGDAYTDLGVVVSDTSDGGLIDEITVNDTLVDQVVIDTSMPHEYNIVYRVTNESGGSAVATRIVRIVAAEPEPVAGSATSSDVTASNTPSANEAEATDAAEDADLTTAIVAPTSTDSVDAPNSASSQETTTADTVNETNISSEMADEAPDIESANIATEVSTPESDVEPVTTSEPEVKPAAAPKPDATEVIE